MCRRIQPHGLVEAGEAVQPRAQGIRAVFLKPSSDRVHAIKELFPVGLVPPTEEDASALVTPPRSQSTRARRKGANIDMWRRQTGRKGVLEQADAS